MPKSTPKIGGTEQELEQQIHDDILDLQLQLNTDNFGSKAIEHDRKKEQVKAAKAAAASERS